MPPTPEESARLRPVSIRVPRPPPRWRKIETRMPHPRPSFGLGWGFSSITESRGCPSLILVDPCSKTGRDAVPILKQPINPVRPRGIKLAHTNSRWLTAWPAGNRQPPYARRALANQYCQRRPGPPLRPQGTGRVLRGRRRASWYREKYQTVNTRFVHRFYMHQGGLVF